MAVELMADVIKYVNDTNKDVKWDHSEFPHNLVTVDYGANGEVIAVSVIVPQKVRLEIHDRQEGRHETERRAYPTRDDNIDTGGWTPKKEKPEAERDRFETIRDRAIKEIPELQRIIKRIKNG